MVVIIEHFYMKTIIGSNIAKKSGSTKSCPELIPPLFLKNGLSLLEPYDDPHARLFYDDLHRVKA